MNFFWRTPTKVWSNLKWQTTIRSIWKSNAFDKFSILGYWYLIMPAYYVWRVEKRESQQSPARFLQDILNNTLCTFNYLHKWHTWYRIFHWSFFVLCFEITHFFIIEKMSPCLKSLGLDSINNFVELENSKNASISTLYLNLVSWLPRKEYILHFL